MTLPVITRPTPSTTSSTAGGNWTGNIIREPKRVLSGQKPKIRIDDLPYGRGGGKLWRDKFTPMLLAWAGSQEDPFAANSHHNIHSVITQIWEHVYPDFPLQDDGDAVILEKSVRSP